MAAHRGRALPVHAYWRNSMTIRPGRLRPFLLAVMLGASLLVSAEQRSQSQDQSYSVDYYYTARWGYADEFIRLFKKNHWPLLKKQVETGRMISVTAVRAAISRRRGRAVGLSRDNRLQEPCSSARFLDRRGIDQADVSGSGYIPQGRAAPV